MIESKRLLKNIVRMFLNDENRIGHVMRLDRNERTIPLDKDTIEAVWKTITPEEVVAYGNLNPLYDALAKFLNVGKDNILLGSGSDILIKSLFEVYIEENDEVVILSPSYGMFYVYADTFGAKKVLVGYDKNFNVSVSEFKKAIHAKTRLVLIANPNHTASVMPQQDIRAIIEHAAQFNAMVLVDEAYYEFYGETMAAFINTYSNLVVSRTFSKAFGIAGLRVGYLISQKENIKNLEKVRQTHEVTSVSAKFAEYLLKHPNIFQQYAKDLKESKEYLRKECALLNIETLVSHTNFVFLRLPAGLDGKEIVQQLEKRKILIKGPFKDVPIDGLIRITIGPVSQMKEFMKVFKEIVVNTQTSLKG